jgi:hypothetical protein
LRPRMKRARERCHSGAGISLSSAARCEKL